MSRGLEKRWIQRMNVEVTFMGFGALEIGRNWGLGSGEEVQRPAEEEAGRVLNTVLEMGINLIDTASAYHQSEKRIGKFMAHRRHEYVLASKCGEHNDEPGTFYDFSYKAVKESIDRSLQLLQTDVIDIMQIHFGPNSEKVLSDGETLAAMKDAQKEGKIRFLGASIDGDLATRCITSGDFDVMQMEYNLINQTNQENIRLAKVNGIGVLVRGGLAGGMLSARVLPHLNSGLQQTEKLKSLLDLVNHDGDLLAALAMQFLYREEGISSVLIGTKQVQHLKANMQLLDRAIPDELLSQAIDIGKQK